MAGSWIMDFDEDDDEQLSLPELGPLLAQMARLGILLRGHSL